MKTVSTAVVLAVLCGLAVNAGADVQNIRLSGDVRLRGYLLENTADDDVGDQQKGGAAFIEQRTRVTVEADLEDHVLVVVSLKAESLWGQDNQSLNDAGAGSAGPNGAINRTWDVGIDQAYVKLIDVFYSPATVIVGRQYLNYGHGLILSSYDQEYNFDAGRLVLDFYPFTVDLVGAEVVNNQSFATAGSHAGSADLLFLNARYEMTDAVIKDVEGYFGYLSQGSSSVGPITSSRIPPTTGGAPFNGGLANTGASPLIVGARTDLNLTEGLSASAEGVYEWGADGTGASPGSSGGRISAFLANAGVKFGRKDWAMSPVFNASYTYASGGGGNGHSGNASFVPWFDYVEGYNGYLLSPALSNIQIFNVGATIKLCENTTLAVQGYYYLKSDENYQVASNPNIDFGGLNYPAGGASREVGWEVDAILGYDYSQDARLQLVYALFIPGSAMEDTSNSPGNSAAAHELRVELDVKF